MNTTSLINDHKQDAPEKTTILIVEDEVDAKELFVSLLSLNPSYRVLSGGDGQEALDILEKEKVDLVLLDIIMPRMDGIQALKEIKLNPNKYGTPLVVMLTNVGGDVARDNAKELNADGYIMKIDTEPEELLRKVEETIDSKLKNNSSNLNNKDGTTSNLKAA